MFITEIDIFPIEICCVCNEHISTLDESVNKCKCDLDAFAKRINQITFLEQKERMYVKAHWFLFKNKVGFCDRCHRKCNGYCR